MKKGRELLQVRLAEMLVGGVIVEVTTPEQAALAEAAGASGVMVVEALAADARLSQQVQRMADPAVIKSIQAVTSIPLMAKCRVGHLVEAEMLAALGVDYIDESELLTPVGRHLDKCGFSTPFICGATDLVVALQRLAEGAAVIRCGGQPGTGNIALAAEQLRQLAGQAKQLQQYPLAELPTVATELGVDQGLLQAVAKRGRLPAVLWGAGGVATPADAALLRRAGADCVLVGSGIFHAGQPRRRAEAIITATAHYDDIELINQVSTDLGSAMPGWQVAAVSELPAQAEGGWSECE